jgi:hypothetical protein
MQHLFSTRQNYNDRDHDRDHDTIAFTAFCIEILWYRFILSGIQAKYDLEKEGKDWTPLWFYSRQELLVVLP